MKQILVTGAAGFIGSHLADELLKRGHNVIGVDDFNDFYDPEIKRANLQQASQNSNFKNVEADIRDPNLFKGLFLQSRPDVVVHLAARAGVRPSLQQPHLYYDVNVMGSLNLLEAMRMHHVKQFVFASSSSVYGNRIQGPFKETDTTDSQVSPYGASKKALEGLAATYAHLYGIQTTGLRFFTVYGPRNRPSMACSLFMEAIAKGDKLTQFGDGSTGRDYTYIDDIVEGIIKAIDNPFDYEIFNLGNSSPVLLSELIETIEQIVGQKAHIKIAPLQPGDVMYTYADISKAQRLISWQPRTELKAGLTHLYQWMKA